MWRPVEETGGPCLEARAPRQVPMPRQASCLKATLIVRGRAAVALRCGTLAVQGYSPVAPAFRLSLVFSFRPAGSYRRVPPGQRAAPYRPDASARPVGRDTPR